MSDSEIDATRRAWSAEVTALQKMLADAEALLAEAEAACAALRTWINAQASVCPCGGALGGHAPQCGARMVLSSDAGAGWFPPAEVDALEAEVSAWRAVVSDREANLAATLSAGEAARVVIAALEAERDALLADLRERCAEAWYDWVRTDAAWAAGAAARAAHNDRFEVIARELLALPEDRLADALTDLLARMDAKEVTRDS